MHRLITFLLAAASSTLVLAGPSVYRCEEAGKILFSDAPCVGAQVIDTTPNRGLGRSSATGLKSAAPRASEINDAIDDPIKPAAARDRDAPEPLRRRVQLKVGEGETCKQMDESMSRLHEAAQQPEPNAKAQAEFQLDIARAKYFALKC